MSSRIRFDSIFSLTNLAFNNVLSAASFSNQLPSDTVTPIQVNFGAAQSTDFLDLAADGTITFKQKGNYAIIIQGIFSRTGSSGQVAQINFRGTLNGTDVGYTQHLALDKEDQAYPYERTQPITAAKDDVLRFYIARDSSGVNLGGLYTYTISTSGWSNAPSAAIIVFKLG